MSKSKEIELDRLEWNWQEQQDLIEKAIEDLTEAKEELDVAETALEVIAADLSLKIRARPRKYGLRTCTEPAIKATVILQSEWRKAKYKVIKKKHKVGIFQARVTAYDHRKKALEKLTDLHGQGYWSKPKSSKINERKMERERQRQRRQHDDD